MSANCLKFCQSCQQIHISQSCVMSADQSCLHFCQVSRSTSRSPVSTLNADPSCLYFCHDIVTSRSPVATSVMSADLPHVVLSPLSLCQQIHLVSTFTSQQHHLSQSCIHFVMSANPPTYLSQSFLYFCHVSRSTSRSRVSTLNLLCQQIHLVSTFVMSTTPPLAVPYPFVISADPPPQSSRSSYLSQSYLHFCQVSRSTSCSPVTTFVKSADSPLASCLHFCYVSRSTLSPLLS